MVASVPAHLHAGEPPAAAPPATDAVDLTFFRAPKIKSAVPTYPKAQEQQGNEGWVVLTMMIDPRGKPYEVEVVQSIGSPVFEREALKSIDNMVFEPATDGGAAVDSSLNIKVTFYLQKIAQGARVSFVSAYREALRAIESGDRELADQSRTKLKAMNLYEDAYQNIAAFQYHQKWGTEADQLTDLQRAIAGEKRDRYLNRDLFRSALKTIMTLQAKRQDFGGALETWELLKPIVLKEDLPYLQHMVEQISTLRASDGVVRMSGEIVGGLSWVRFLFKRHFRIDVAEGQVGEIKLRCQKSYISFKFEPGIDYSVDNSAGNCTIELVGDSGTKFQLTQF